MTFVYALLAVILAGLVLYFVNVSVQRRHYEDSRRDRDYLTEFGEDDEDDNDEE